MKRKLLIIIGLTLIFSQLLACDSGKKTGFVPEVVEETIEIEGISKEYKLLYITDTHMVVPTDSDSENEMKYANERKNMFYDAQGHSAAEQFSAWMDYANENAVDAVLLGGDIIDSPSSGNIAYLEDNLATLNMPYLMIPGNHDWTYPWDYMTESGKETYMSLLPFSKNPYTDNPGECQVLEFEDLMIVGINDSSNQVTQEAFDGFMLANEEKKPIIVLAHVPFMTQTLLVQARETWSSPTVLGGGGYGGIYPDEISGKFLDAIVSKDSNVELVLGGHVHFYNDDMIEGEKNVRQIVGDDGFSGKSLLLHVKPVEE